MPDTPTPDASGDPWAAAQAWRAIAESLAVEDPWQDTCCGLDDHCTFCGSWQALYVREAGHKFYDVNGRPIGGSPSHTIHNHEADCAWMAARIALGYTDPLHDLEGDCR